MTRYIHWIIYSLFYHVNQACLLFLIPFKFLFLSDCMLCEVALETAETMKWSALAAICDFICPLLGSGLRPAKLFSS